MLRFVAEFVHLVAAQADSGLFARSSGQCWIFLEAKKFLGKNCLPYRSLCCIVICDILEFLFCRLVLRLAKAIRYCKTGSKAVAYRFVALQRCVMGCWTIKKVNLLEGPHFPQKPQNGNPDSSAPSASRIQFTNRSFLK